MSLSNNAVSLSHADSPRQRDHSIALPFDIVSSPQEIPIYSEPSTSADNMHLLAPKDRSRAPSRLRNIVGDGDNDEEDDNGSSVTSEDEDERPWYKRPSPWWILLISGFATCLTSMTVAAKTEVFILLVCEEYRPGVAPFDNSTGPSYTSAPWQHPTSDLNVLFRNGGLHPQYGAKVPRPTSLCRADPEVGRDVAELGTMVALVLGILSVLTTGFWSKLLDSKGRTWVLRFVALGSVLSDINFIAVTLRSRRVAGSYNRFVWSSIADGLVGGTMTRSAAAHAYVSDCTHPTARSRVFSLYLGIAVIGLSIGPARESFTSSVASHSLPFMMPLPQVGGVIISRTGNLLTPFYVATAGHVVYFLVVCFLVPESLSKRQMTIITERRKAEDDLSREEITRSSRRIGLRVGRVARALGGFLEPLMVFAPVNREQSGSVRKRDWNLLYIAGASAFVALLVGSPQYKFQYTAALFDWTSEEIGYWVSAVEVVRFFHLVILLPLITKIFGPRNADLRAQDVASGDQNQSTTSGSPEQPPHIHSSRSDSPDPLYNSGVSSRYTTHNALFDLRIAKGSLMVEVITSFLTSLSFGPRMFCVATILSSFSAGFAPGYQSLALSLMPRGSADAGKLFGAFSVIHSLVHIAGPAVYGATYILTNVWLPQGIFWLSFLISSAALALFSFIRLPPALPHTRGIP
ncbi:uncharacterized protein EI90DRAFT_3115030 [Cantharellus anzutake]|uniref:uncharacterized protein n=1 Tax=Cantharellus anzutake TaxID=1750568 RepID=UPI001905A07F|nr:uncharacterized protein EI90DRAFT_3115030 [Cantharellus anzutake]KAF8344282.1 hypothetical protein EI90DRAFT_3115030 [Cantharellus anzutake]